MLTNRNCLLTTFANKNVSTKDFLPSVCVCDADSDAGESDQRY